MNLPAFARLPRRSFAVAIAACLALALTATAAFGFGAFRPARHLPITGGSPYPVAIADFNSDGRNDVAVGSENDDIVNVLYGKPGGLEPARQFPAGDYPFGIVARDFNKDGHTDMAVVAESDDAIALLLSRPGGFRNPVLFDTGPPGDTDDPVAAATADFNRDRRPDIAVANDATGTMGVLLGKPGGFKPVRTYSTGGAATDPVDVTSGDFNRDGRADVAVLNSNHPTGSGGTQVAVFIGIGDGTFRGGARSDGGSDGAYGFVKGRFNPGGKLDLAVSDCNGDDKLFLLRGKGDGRFRAPVDYPTVSGSCGYEPTAADFNRDGRLDVANVSQDNGKVAISFQRASGGFGSPRLLSAVAEAYSVAAARLNGDRAPDLAVPDYSNPDIAILFNRP